jgi:hypothetical protein
MREKGYKIFLEAVTWQRMADRVAEAIGKIDPEIRELRIQASKLAYMTHEVLGPDHAIRMRTLFSIPKGAEQEWKGHRDARSVMAQYRRTLSLANKAMGIWVPDSTKAQRRLLVSSVKDIFSGKLSKRKIEGLMRIKVPTRTGATNRRRPTR